MMGWMILAGYLVFCWLTFYMAIRVEKQFHPYYVTNGDVVFFAVLSLIPGFNLALLFVSCLGLTSKWSESESRWF